jgi:hypothetical protein
MKRIGVARGGRVHDRSPPTALGAAQDRKLRRAADEGRIERCSQAVSFPRASRVSLDPTDPALAPASEPAVLQQDPLTVHPYPVIARPSPVAASVHMTGRRGDHDLFDKRRRHRSDRNLNIVPMFPTPTVLPPYVVPGHPVVAGGRRRRRLFDNGRRRLMVDDDAWRRCWLANDRGASHTETRANDGCTHRELTNHVALSPVGGRHRRAPPPQLCGPFVRFGTNSLHFKAVARRGPRCRPVLRACAPTCRFAC